MPVYATAYKTPSWWLRLGIKIQRIEPGYPQQNGRLERMQLTLKKETTKPGRSTPLKAQYTPGRW